MKPHALTVYLRQGALFVVPCVPRPRLGMDALDLVIPVIDGWNGLSAALREGERLALEELKRPADRRRFGNNSRLVEAAGSKSFPDFARGAIACTIARAPRYVLAMKMVPNTKGTALVGRSGQKQFPADTSIEELAEIARRILEAPEIE